MIKVIELSHMTSGIDGYGRPSKNIESQMQEIFYSNLNYKYVDLVYRPSGRSVNMEYATLIVEVDEIVKEEVLSTDKRYWKCGKCGSAAYTDGDYTSYATCIEPTPVRTSGICGGSLSVEISEQEYNERCSNNLDISPNAKNNSNE